MKGTGLVATTYTYDSFHNLKSVTFPLGGGAVNYDIDGLGRRVGRHRTGSSPSDRYYLLGEGNRILAEYDANGTMISRFIYATHSHVPDYMIQGSNIYRFITDQLGSVRLVVNVNAASASASIVQQIDYDAWGVVTNTPSTFDQPFGFAGGLWDRDTGLVHFGAREYDPLTGRWLQKDPIRFRGGDTNLYAYAGNDPVNGIDPTGLWRLTGGLEWGFNLISPFQGQYWGVNYQCFSTGCGWYLVQAPMAQDRWNAGVSVGPSLLGNLGVGDGPWSGDFGNLGGGVKSGCGGVYWTPGVPVGDASSGWRGVEGGVGAGPSQLLASGAYTRPNYQPAPAWVPIAMAVLNAGVAFPNFGTTPDTTHP